MEPVLITGITGFVGSYLAELLLADGLPVAGLARGSAWIRGAEHLANKIEVHDVDLTDLAAVVSALEKVRPHQIYHLAGLASVPASSRDPALAWLVNFHGTQNLFHGLKQANIDAKILCVSSGTVYGRPALAELPITETSRYDPQTPYAQSKLAADLLGLDWARRGLLNLVIARPFNHIGPRQHGEFAIAEFASQVARLENHETGSLKCGKLDVERDFTDVRDVVRAYRAIMNKGSAGEVFNVASGKPRLLADMLGQLLALARRPIAVDSMAEKFRTNDPAFLRVDISNLTSRTGWRPEIPIETTLADTLEFARKSLQP